MASSAAYLRKRPTGYPDPENSIRVVSVMDWIKGFLSNPIHDLASYLRNLFPILQWIRRYNLTWLTGDVIAGLTVGMVLVPQSMSYAQLATLPPQYGLYSSFVGVMVYLFFATSKDVSMGPVAIMSLTVAQIIKDIEQHHGHLWTRPDIATTLAFVCGFIVLGIGILRIGWIVEFIPAPAISGFMTGSAITIVASQVPGLMGITGFDTRAEPYRVIIHTLKGLPRTRLDAAWGLTGLFALYAVRITCNRLSKRYPRRARLCFFISCMRNSFVVVILTIAAWLYCRHRKSKSGAYPIKILQHVPRGFQNVGPPPIKRDLVIALAPHLPVATIILLLEHIAVGKSFGRINNYKINPNQELIAMGVTNTIGSVFRAYPATGSFSRSALKSQSGVRTPAASIFTAMVVIVALYGLTPAFFWIPTAGLSAVIIHAVADLVASPSQIYTYWRISPLEFLIWVAAVLTTVFSTIENGIYTSTATSFALLLLRIAHPRENFLGRIAVHNSALNDKSSSTRQVFVPFKSNGIINPDVEVSPPSPGVIIYRLEEALTYPNSSRVNNAIVEYIKTNTRRGADLSVIKPGDRPWNDPGPAPGVQDDSMKPLLHAVVLDFSTVSQIDTTGVQSLIDTRSEVERWAKHAVEFHFAGIQSPWIRRALIAGAFGIGAPAPGPPIEATAVFYSHLPRTMSSKLNDEETPDGKHGTTPTTLNDGLQSLVPTDTPHFHLDLIAAVHAAESGIGRNLTTIS